jgi:hypothetical protein
MFRAKSTGKAGSRPCAISFLQSTALTGSNAPVNGHDSHYQICMQGSVKWSLAKGWSDLKLREERRTQNQLPVSRCLDREAGRDSVAQTTPARKEPSDILSTQTIDPVPQGTPREVIDLK